MPDAWDLIDPRSPLSGAGRIRHLRDVRDNATCPHCLMRWRASAPTPGAHEKDFNGVIYCPDCFEGSRTNPRLYTPVFWDGRRLPMKERDR